MSSAISFGVFWRLAPSTSAIIRSRKLSPGSDVTRTTIRSESTRVPPVTAERSPPDSRMTGADSPVIADSSTLAMPSIDVAVGRDQLARGDDDLVARRSAALGTSSTARPAAPVRDRLGACPAERRRLRLAAALGHRLGEVREEHREPQPGRDQACEDARGRGRTARSRGRCRPRRRTSPGCAPCGAGRACGRSPARPGRRSPGRTGTEALVMPRCSRTGPSDEHGEVGEADDDQDDADEEAGEERRAGRERPGRRGDVLLPRERAREREHGDDQQEPADQHREPERRVEPAGVAVRPPNAEPLLFEAEVNA